MEDSYQFSSQHDIKKKKPGTKSQKISRTNLLHIYANCAFNLCITNSEILSKTYSSKFNKLSRHKLQT